MSSQQERSLSQRNAFTLIELLVVIGVIAMVAAILFPVFAQAREKSRQAVCTSNLHQISRGLLMYVADYDERLPAMSGFTGSGTCGHDPSGGRGSNRCNNDMFVQMYGWALMTMPYVKNVDLFQCPSFPVDTYKWDGYIYRGCFRNWPPREQFPRGITYELKLALAANSRAGNSMASILAPAATIWVLEISTPHTFNMHACGGAQGIECFQNPKQSLIQKRREMGVNTSFADGHVKYTRIADTWFAKYNRFARLETYDPHWLQRKTSPSSAVADCDPSRGQDLD